MELDCYKMIALKKELFWIPADLPIFEHKKELVQLYVQDYQNQKVAKAFGSQMFTHRVENYAVSKFKNDYEESHKHLYDYINTHLPYDNLVNVKIHNNIRQGKAHVDFVFPEKNKELYANNTGNEPCGYRMVIAGDRQGHLFVDKTNADGSTERVYPTLPETTDWYILNSTSAYHGLDGVNPDRYILFCHAWINKQQHDEIIKRSLEKYSDYAIWS
jgi:hypothetical protein